MRGVHKGSGVLYVVSHAKTRYNDPGADKDRVQGWLNVPIDSQGRREAAMLGKFFKGKAVDKLHTSDLARADQTADIVGRLIDVPVTSARRYRPWNLGTYAGHSSEEVIPKLKPYMTSRASDPVDGGESFNAFRDRFIPAFEALLKKAEAGKTVVLVTHSRDIELIQGWLGGRNYRSKVDPREITADTVKPATVFMIAEGKQGKFQVKELARETVTKAVQARRASLRLRVGGMHGTPTGERVYRMYKGRPLRRPHPTHQPESVERRHPLLWTRLISRLIRRVTRTGSPPSSRVRPLTHPTRGGLWKLWPAPHPPGCEGRGRMAPPPTLSRRRTRTTATTPRARPGTSLCRATPTTRRTASTTPTGVSSTTTSATRRQRYEGPTRKDGPTLSQVHVPAPLPNISVSYAASTRHGQKRNTLNTLDAEDVLYVSPVHKDGARQILFGIVLKPNVVDTQDDFMRPRTLRMLPTAT